MDNYEDASVPNSWNFAKIRQTCYKESFGQIGEKNVLHSGEATFIS